MKIPIQIRDQKYEVSGDEHQFILTKVTGKDKTTGESTGRRTFFPNLEYLLEDLYKMGLRTSDVDSFRGLREEAEKLREVIAEIKDKLELLTVHTN